AGRGPAPRRAADRRRHHPVQFRGQPQAQGACGQGRWRSGRGCLAGVRPRLRGRAAGGQAQLRAGAPGRRLTRPPTRQGAAGMDAGTANEATPELEEGELSLAGAATKDVLFLVFMQVPVWLLVMLLVAWPMKAMGTPLPAIPELMLVMLLTAVIACHYRCRITATDMALANAALRRLPTWGWIVLGVLAMEVMDFVVLRVSEWAGQPLVASNHAPIVEAMGASPWLAWLSVCVLGPVAEELAFRRLLFGRFLRAGRPWLGLVLTSVLFACMHEVPGFSEGPWWATGLLWIAYLNAGAVFAGLYWRTGTLWA